MRSPENLGIHTVMALIPSLFALQYFVLDVHTAYLLIGVLSAFLIPFIYDALKQKRKQDKARSFFKKYVKLAERLRSGGGLLCKGSNQQHTCRSAP